MGHGLQVAYATEQLRPTQVIDAVLERIAAHGTAGMPLFGVTYAVKDSIDVAGLATMAGCPAFPYWPDRNAGCVQRLLDAGAIVVGKTNMDQFTTGLTGTRSPYGAAQSVFGGGLIAGCKPTRGLISTAGVVPACRSLDCVSFLTATVADAETVLGVISGPVRGDASDSSYPPSRARLALPTGRSPPWMPSGLGIGSGNCSTGPISFGSEPTC